jgi:hypothetical protein
MICRPATPDDMGFIAETFLRSVRLASTHVEGLENGQVVSLLMNLLANGWTATVCESDLLIVGWTVHRSAKELAWMYVRDMFRGQGVGDYMLKCAGIDKRKQMTSPFIPNRGTRRWRIQHRPWMCLPTGGS